MVIGVVFYRIFNKILQKWFVVSEPIDIQKYNKHVRQFFVLFAFFMCTSSTTIFLELVPKKPGYEYVPEEPWSMISFLGSIFLAIIIYSVGSRIFMRKRETETQETGEPAQRS